MQQNISIKRKEVTMLNKNEKLVWLFLIISYIIVISFKIVLSEKFLSPCISDEIGYYFISKSPLNAEIFPFRYPPLFPALFYPVHLFINDIETKYQIIKIVNILVATTAIFPAYLLSRIFLNKWKSLFVSVLVVLVPTHFVLGSFLIRPEGLFLVLFLFATYFIFKYEKTKSNKYIILGGIFASLLVLTKVLGLVIIVSYLLTDLVRNKKPNVFFYLPVILMLIPYFLHRVFKYDISEGGLFGYSIINPAQTALREGFALNIVEMIVSHFDCLILGSGFIFGVFSLALLYKVFQGHIKDNHIKTFIIFSWISILATILICGLFLPGEPTIRSRYVFFLLPLIFIMGLRYVDLSEAWIDPVTLSFAKTLRNINSPSLRRLKNTFFIREGKYIYYAMITIAITLSWFSGIRIEGGWGERSLIIAYFDTNITYFVFGVSIFILLFSLLFTFHRKQIITYTSLLLVFFLLMFGTYCSYVDTSSWTVGWYEVGSIGRYLSETDDDIIYDKDFYETHWGSGCYYAISFWADKQIIINDIDNSHNSYVITQKELSSEMGYEYCDSRRCIFVYENSK